MLNFKKKEKKTIIVYFFKHDLLSSSLAYVGS